MDDAFEKLKKSKQNSVDNLIKWMKNSKLIDESKTAEEKARKLFTDVADASNVELDKFKQAISKLADEQKKTVAEFTKMLEKEGPRVMNALSAGLSSAVAAGASAFKDALGKK